MMKKITRNLVAAFAVTFLFVGLAQAQYFADYVEAVTGGSEEIDTVTTGTQTGLYAEPDPYYSPAYNTANNTGLGTDQYWDWTITNGTASGSEAAVYEQVLGDTSNYIEIAWSGTGTVTVDVAERNGAVSCAGATQSMTVQVIDPSTVTFSADNPGGNVFGGTNDTIKVCATDLTRLDDFVQVAFSQSVAFGSPSYQVQYTITIDTITSGGAINNIAGYTESYMGSAGNQVASTADILNLAQPVDHGSGVGFVCITNGGTSAATLYTYRIQGVTDRISRKSDFLLNPTKLANGWTWYDTTLETLTVQVNPAPVTGPIYHISNMWAN